VFDFKFDGGRFGKGGTGSLIVDGKPVDTKHIDHTVPFIFQRDETFDVDAGDRFRRLRPRGEDQDQDEP
jgi:arylsulfatase